MVMITAQPNNRVTQQQSEGRGQQQSCDPMSALSVQRQQRQQNEDEDEEAQWAEWSSLSEEQLYRRLAERAARRASKAVSAAAKQQTNSKLNLTSLSWPHLS